MSTYADRVAEHWAGVDTSVLRSFWQSPVVMRLLNERITGRTGIDRFTYFKEKYAETPFRRGISLGSGNGYLERRVTELGIVEEIVGVDLSAARLEHARESLPPHLGKRVTYVCADLEVWEPEGAFDLLFCKSILHHIEGLERWMEIARRGLRPGGHVYVDDFVGPTRFQWTDRQLEVLNRILTALPEEYKRDLTRDGGVRQHIGRPEISKFIQIDPSEAIRSDEILGVLDQYLEPVEVKPYGGAVYHQLFSRTMGNFEGNESLVRVLVELDLLLMDLGVLDTNYVWGVWRPR